MLLPLVSFQRLEYFGGEGTIYNGANFLERGRASGRKNLHRDISQRRCLGGAGHHISARGVSSQLVQQAIFGPASDDTNLPDALPAHVFQIAENKTVFEGKALQNGSHVRASFLRDWLVSPGTEPVDCSEHIFGAQEGLVIGIEEVTEWCPTRCQFDQLPIVVALA